ncbi:DUF881 domain-containing protein [Scrofimicrobium sp. R131]|uniref:DUF881 domain-containing protein n=1 Tax=Scrofimicrobium appendicitidis TaxID=3079930 RepID=A0AAU7V753_9ACTO
MSSHNRGFFHTFFARPRPLHLIMLVLFVVLGLALATQVKLQRTDPLETLSEDELIQLLSELEGREDGLRAERRQLEQQLRELDSAASQLAATQEAAEKLQRQAQIAAGLVPVKGPGIIIGVADPQHQLTAQVFVTTLAELRNSGAEAISINDVRLTLQSWFSQDGDHIIVDGHTLEAPYTWRAIGDAQTLATAMEIRGGAASQMRAYNAVVTIQQSEELEIKSVAPPLNPKWATVEKD